MCDTDNSTQSVIIGEGWRLEPHPCRTSSSRHEHTSPKEQAQEDLRVFSLGRGSHTHTK